MGCAFLIWALGILATSSQLHGSLHDDAGHVDHACAVTHFSQGAENPAPQVSVVVGAALCVAGTLVPGEPLLVESPIDWLEPGRGPPLR